MEHERIWAIAARINGRSYANRGPKIIFVTDTIDEAITKAATYLGLSPYCLARFGAICTFLDDIEAKLAEWEQRDKYLYPIASLPFAVRPEAEEPKKFSVLERLTAINRDPYGELQIKPDPHLAIEETGMLDRAKTVVADLCKEDRQELYKFIHELGCRIYER